MGYSSSRSKGRYGKHLVERSLLAADVVGCVGLHVYSVLAAYRSLYSSSSLYVRVSSQVQRQMFFECHSHRLMTPSSVCRFPSYQCALGALSGKILIKLSLRSLMKLSSCSSDL